jgi:polyisoprenoid-binding protein YceI
MTTTMTFLEAGTWTLDPAHSQVSFRVRHLMAAKVRGSFKDFKGSIEAGDTLETSSVSVTIDAASIDTGVADRDAHLRSGDFLDVENFETLSFSSSEVRDTSNGFEVDGELTIRGVTRPVTLDAEFSGIVADPWGNEKAIFSATTKINREDWGLTWNAALETGGVLVGKEVTIEIEAQAVRA